jgi:hypothetical protein
MSANLKTLAVVGTLAIGALLAVGAPAAHAQGYPPGASQTFYYPSAGYYATTAGSVYIPAPGYYYNVPANYAATPPTVYAPAPRYTYPGPGYGYGYGFWPSYGYSGYSAPRGGGGPNNPPYYSGAQHTLHGRGWDSGSHGR